MKRVITWELTSAASLLLAFCCLTLEACGDAEDRPGSVGDGGQSVDRIGGSAAGDDGSGACQNQPDGTLVPGDTCTEDCECAGDARCLPTIVPGGEKYCAPLCTDETAREDCQPLGEHESFFEIPVPANLSDNNYNASALSRGLGCLPAADLLMEDESDTRQYCITLCPRNAAKGYDSDGAVESCICLPNFRSDPETPEGVFRCIFDPDVACSILKPCDADSEILGSEGECDAKNIVCVMGDSLEGVCWDRFTNKDLYECTGYMPGTGTVCDPNCLGACAGNMACLEMCCGF